MKILIIEDKDMQACLQRALKDKGTEIDGLCNLEIRICRPACKEP